MKKFMQFNTACDFYQPLAQSTHPLFTYCIMAPCNISCTVPGCLKQFKLNKGLTYHFWSMHQYNNEIHKTPSPSESLECEAHNFNNFNEEWSPNAVPSPVPKSPLPLPKPSNHTYHPNLTGE